VNLRDEEDNVQRDRGKQRRMGDGVGAVQNVFSN
jgi:hypothetical protein